MTFGDRRDGNNDSGYYRFTGSRGEKASESLLKHIFPGYNIRDVRNVTEWQRKDVDYIACLDRDSKFFESKTDKWLPKGNFCFEVMRIRHNTAWEHSLYVGWSIRSEAHVFLMFSPSTQVMYVVNHCELVKGLQGVLQQDKRPNVGFVPTDPKRTTLNIYIPQKYVAHLKYKWDGYKWTKEQS